jgi:hypothetical protein
MTLLASTYVLEHETMSDTLSAITRDTPDPALAAHLWAVLLDTSSPFDATIALVDAAFSDEVTVRRATAEALIWDFPVLGADVILEHLSHDPSAVVRFAVARAVHARRRSLGDTLLIRLAVDPDDRVAAAASFALATR